MRRRFERAERGAMAIFIALTTCFVVIPLGALAVDIGTQRVSRVDAQAVADTTALDMARLLASSSGSSAVTDAAAAAAAARTSGWVGSGMTVHAYTGTITPANFISDQSLGCNGTKGNNYFTPTTTTPNAVLVTVSNSVNFAIHGGTGGVCRSSIATASQQQACVAMDSYAASLNSGDSSVLGLLNKYLGTNLNTTILGSSGILTANMNVLDFINALQTQLSLGSSTAVLAANVTAAQIIQAEETALNSEGLLQSAGLLQGVNIPAGTSVSVSGLLGSMGVTQGGSSGLATTLNPLDLAMAAAQLANGSTPLSASIASPPNGLTALTANVTLGSSPQQVCLGDTPPTKTMGQTSITATLNLNAPGTITGAVTNLVNSLTSLLGNVVSTILGLLNSDSYAVQTINLSNAQYPVTAKVALAAASGKVNSLTCNGLTPTAMNVQEGASLAPASITIPLIINAQHKYGMVLGLGGATEYATAIFLVNVSTQPTTDQSVAANFTLPGDFDKPKNGPSNNLSVQYTSATVTTIDPGTFAHGGQTVAGLFGLSNVNALVNQVNSTVIGSLEQYIIGPLLTTLTNTLQSTIGTTFAGSTYTALSKRTTCGGTPKLAG